MLREKPHLGAPMNFTKSLNWVAGVIFVIGSLPSIACGRNPELSGVGMDRRSRSCCRRKHSRRPRSTTRISSRGQRAARKHTLTSVPRWDGLWVTAGNTHMDMFVDPPGFHRQGSSGRADTALRCRLTRSVGCQQQELGEVQYDRLDPLRAGGLSAVAARALLA